MMDWTDRPCRVFHRRLSADARLYTEMVTSAALKHGPRARLLRFDPSEHPVALQLGGSDPRELAQAARFGELEGYDEINLNCGCPSDRVQSGRFGACLMREPDLVADCFKAMRDAVSIPITIKCRIGVDEQDDDRDLLRFVERISRAGCDVFIVHARKAWLKGLSPKENRDVPPLNYPRVYRLKEEFPQLTIVLNGGLTEINEVQLALKNLDGVMLGRAAYHTPFLIAQLQQALFTPDQELPDRIELLRGMRSFAELEMQAGHTIMHYARHWLGLFQGEPGARVFRRVLSEESHKAGADWRVVELAIEAMQTTAARLQGQAA